MQPKKSSIFLVVLYLLSIPLFVSLANTAEIPIFFWQYLDMDLLRRHLLQSLYLLHAQPPLLDLILGISLKIGGDDFPWVIYVLQGGVILLNIYILRRIFAILDFKRLWLWLLLLSPPMYLYSSWFYEPIYGMTCIDGVILGLLEFHKKRGAALFLFSLTMLSLLHATFHPLLVIVFALTTYAYLRKKLSLGYSARYFLTIAALMFLLPLLVLAKDITRFDSYALSSWGGCNLIRNVVIKDDPGFAPFMDVSVPEAERTVLNTTRKEKNQVNYNYSGMIGRCKAKLALSFQTIAAHPLQYVKYIVRNIIAVGKNRSYDVEQLTGLWTDIGKIYFYSLYYFALRPMEWLMFPLVLFVPLLFFPPRRLPEFSGAMGNLAPLAGLYYVHMLIICGFNGGEQERLNVKFYAFIFISSVVALQVLWRRVIPKRS